MRDLYPETNFADFFRVNSTCERQARLTIKSPFLHFWLNETAMQP